MGIKGRNSNSYFAKKRKGADYHTKDVERAGMIKKLYLSGMPANEIGKVAGIARRTVYYHLQPLKPEEIGEHYQNLAIRQRAAKIQ